MKISFRYLLCVLLNLAALFSQAQSRLEVSGSVQAKNSSAYLGNVTVTNMRTTVLRASNSFGVFKITAAIGDTLQFSKANYLTARVVVTSPLNVSVFLVPVTQLNEITIKGQTTKQQLDDAIDTYRSKGLYFDGRPPLIIFNPINGSPITGFYELFSADARHIRHFIKFAKAEQAAAQDDARFNRDLIKKLTQLPDNEIQKFIDSYKPPHQDLMQWTDYELIQYINQSFEKYKKFGAEALPKLSSP